MLRALRSTQAPAFDVIKMKEREIDVDRLKTFKSHDVQEQIALKKYNLFKGANYYRSNGVPEILDRFLQEKGINITKGLVYDLDENYPGCSDLVGTILTEDGRFYEFDIDLNYDKTKVAEVYVWEDVTDQYEICGNKKGIGQTDGYIALEVLKKLNDNQSVFTTP